MNEYQTPDQLAEEGKALFAREAYLEAAKAFKEAEEGYQSAGEKISAAEMANNRCVALRQAGEYEAALTAVEGTADIFAEANNVRRQAMAFGNKAAVLADLGQVEEAEALYWQSVQLLDEIGESRLRSSVMQSISKLQLRSGRHIEAVTSMKAGLDQVEKPNFTQRMLKKLIDIPFNWFNRS